MPSRYSVIRFYANEKSEEYVNLAVVAVDDKGVQCKTLTDFRRASAFTKRDIPELRAIAEEIQYACDSMLPEDNALFDVASEGLDRMFREWQNSIQLSPPRGSTRTAVELIPNLRKRYLVTHSRRDEDKNLSRTDAVLLGMQALRQGVRGRQFGGSEMRIVNRNDAAVIGRSAKGEDVVCRMDYGLKNGVMRIGGFGASFDLKKEENVQETIDSIAMNVTMIRRADKDIPLCVSVVGMGKFRAAAERADTILGELDCHLLGEDHLGEWVEDEVAKLVRA